MATETQTIPVVAESKETLAAEQTQTPATQHREPLQLKGLLNQYKSHDLTPVIGREYPTINLKQLLRAPNSDDLIRDLAITISRRGVVFFRKQDDLDNDLQKELAQRLGQLSGKPKTSGLHIHPIANAGRRLGGKDNEISVISSEGIKESYSKSNLIQISDKRQNGKSGWHSDITFEPIPSDYAILRLTQLPKTGGDTLWASGYELYDRLSKPYQKFFESLTATYAQPGFGKAAQENGYELYAEQRGAPENVGSELKATHPVIRTNPVTGWKSVFAVGSHVQSIDDLTPEESKAALAWFVQLIADNHDLQVRFRWENPNDLAIWDNRSVYHTATWDYLNLGPRTGQRAVSLGERPYYDPASKSRREALGGQEDVI
ncbi:taurine catabolism dioxygenase [Trichodelitschia bisporula]|uniref:Taurine catabolism dioxygenase n=1 Tax=Trichodelitschia bisporula TaxID=703511 RepID=A0A6G1I9D3_9PEZI|nr:taurine catabolism dioxygenase [Trichodelitschia bisporula]